jgi:CDP-diacylglycerol--glycerol-3-phosphate 3-phosphatidyltransferase
VKSTIKAHARSLLAAPARGLGWMGVTPNHLTLLGLLVSGGAGVLLAYGFFRTGAVVLLVGSLCDMLDGAVARETGRSSPFGAFLDSTVDRVAEMLVFAGLLVHFAREDSILYALLAFLAAGGSFLVSYTRARAEGLGISCEVGWMERPERLVLLILACLLGAGAVQVALWVLTVLVGWTSWQRIRHVQREVPFP